MAEQFRASSDRARFSSILAKTDSLLGPCSNPKPPARCSSLLRAALPSCLFESTLREESTGLVSKCLLSSAKRRNRRSVQGYPRTRNRTSSCHRSACSPATVQDVVFISRLPPGLRAGLAPGRVVPGRGGSMTGSCCSAFWNEIPTAECGRRALRPWKISRRGDATVRERLIQILRGSEESSRTPCWSGTGVGQGGDPDLRRFRTLCCKLSLCRTCRRNSNSRAPGLWWIRLGRIRRSRTKSNRGWI